MYEVMLAGVVGAIVGFVFGLWFVAKYGRMKA